MTTTRCSNMNWNEREMPERWYELLRGRMKVEQERMQAWGWTSRGGALKNGYLRMLQRQAHDLDRQMRDEMRRVIQLAYAPRPNDGGNVVPLRPE